jgi:hypothetical protein
LNNLCIFLFGPHPEPTVSDAATHSVQAADTRTRIPVSALGFCFGLPEGFGNGELLKKKNASKWS